MKFDRRSRTPAFAGLVLIVSLLSACGGGGGESSMTPAGTILFPAEGMSLPDAIITVHGMGSAGADAILVNGQMATSSDGFATWKASIPLAQGGNDIEVVFRVGGQDSVIDSARVYRAPDAVAFGDCSNQVGDEIVFHDRFQHQCFKWNVATGERVAVALPVEIDLAAVRSIAFDAGRNRAMILAGSSLYRVRFDAGLVDTIALTGTLAAGSRDLAHDPVADVYYLLISGSQTGPIASKIIRYLTATDSFDLYASSLDGGLTPDDPEIRSIAWDPTQGRLLAFGVVSQNLFEVEPGGDFLPLSGPGDSIGPNLTVGTTGHLLVDATSGRVHHPAPVSAVVTMSLNSSSRFSTTPASLPYAFYPTNALTADGRLIYQLADRLIAFDVDTGAVADFLRLGPGGLGSQQGAQDFSSIAFDTLRRRLVVGTKGPDLVGLLALDPATRAASVLASGLDATTHTLSHLDYDAISDRFVGLQVFAVNLSGLGNTVSVPAAGGSFDAISGLAVPNQGIVRFDEARDEYLICQSTGNAIGPQSGNEVDLSRNMADGTMVAQLALPGLFQQALDHDPATGITYLAATLSPPSDCLIYQVDAAMGTAQILSPNSSSGLPLPYVKDMVINPVTGELVVACHDRIMGIDQLTGARRLIADLSQRLPGHYPRALTIDPVIGTIYALAVSTAGNIRSNGVIAIEPTTLGWGLYAR